MNLMTVTDDGNPQGGFPVDDRVVEALQVLGRALTATGMSARVRLIGPDRLSSLDLVLGRDGRGTSEVLRARPSTSEGSQLGIDETEGY